MAAPFGGHPTFEKYILWARTQGCKIDYGVKDTADGRPLRVIRISAPTGKRVIEVGTLEADFLMPTTIARLDRRLGLQSPFFSLPDDGS